VEIDIDPLSTSAFQGEEARRHRWGFTLAVDFA